MMKIITKVGNLMNVAKGHIVHGCNAQGVMGSGVALAVKRKFPGAYADYMHIHSTVGLKLGQAYPHEVSGEDNKLVIWNAITQDGFGYGVRQTSYDAVATCFSDINTCVKEMSKAGWNHIPQEVHIPLIGAARGGGNWEIIREIIEQTMEAQVTLWLPDETVDTK